jgi:TBC1 domain family member 2
VLVSIICRLTSTNAELFATKTCSQVSVDVPRTAPEVPLFQHAGMQAALRRLLYIWGVRHPASGYVQGVNDLVTPFFAVFLSEYLLGPMATWDVGTLSQTELLTAEADAYWCLCKLVERCVSLLQYPAPKLHSTAACASSCAQPL